MEYSRGSEIDFQYGGMQESLTWRKLTIAEVCRNLSVTVICTEDSMHTRQQKIYSRGNRRT